MFFLGCAGVVVSVEWLQLDGVGVPERYTTKLGAGWWGWGGVAEWYAPYMGVS